MRHMSNLRKIYTYYSRLGFEDSPDNTFVMSRMQFWRFLKDIKLHHNDVTLTEMDRILGKGKQATPIIEPLKTLQEES